MWGNMKNLFNAIVIVLALAVAYTIYFGVMGSPSRFKDGENRKEPLPGDVLATIYTGGPLVGLLMSLIILAITFVFERAFSINKAKGKGDVSKFVKSVSENLVKGDMDAALEKCNQQRGSLANIMRAAIERFRNIENDSEFQGEKKITEVQRAIDESVNLETPLLEKNLVILSTVASISVLIGLLGTTVGMIRAFQALAMSGTVSAIQLSIGISEALFNTAGGLIGAIIAIISFNYFTTKVDGFIYMIDEAVLNITQIFTIRIKK
jgi:biopolymer transport protein ExbB